jgi:hypothetical protein
LLAAPLLGLALLPASALAENFLVTNLNDSGAGSLRQAILDANANGETDEITFDATFAGGTIVLSTGELVVAADGELTINGDLAADRVPDITVDAGGDSRVFMIESDATAIIRGLVVTGGNSAGDGGGVVTMENSFFVVLDSSISGNSAAAKGGGIQGGSGGIVIVNGGTISGNSAADGGGIQSEGASVTIVASTISGNSATNGGGIHNNLGSFAITNSTISGNSADEGGGGILNLGGGSIFNSTISANSADNGGGLVDRAGFLTIRGTIVAGNTGGDCAAEEPPGSGGFNIDGDGTCGLDHPSDLPDTDPTLGALTGNGGTTETQALLAGSPAIDQIPVDQCTQGEGFPLDTDQRGVTRPQGAACDIGAFELVPPGPEQVLTAAKDSFLRRGAPNLNEGANPGLRLQAAGDNRVVVAFDPDAINAFGDVTSATLVLTIAEIANNWGRRNGRTVDAHPLLVDFAEGNGKTAGVPRSQSTRGSGAGVTWNCAVDTNIANLRPDCASRWNGGTFGMTNAASVLHTNGMSGEVVWDVTLDVRAGVSAWLIKKTDERQPGRVSYFSREGAAAAGDPDLAPRLILETTGPALRCGGETSRCAFVTSTTHDGNLGGLEGGDAICQARAGEGGSLAAPGTYKAWLSTSSTSAENRLTHATVPYKLVDGTTIADDWDDLTDGSLDAAFALTQEGGPPARTETWTGTDAAGNFFGDDCVAWTDATPPPPPPDPAETAGTAGNTSEVDFQWTSATIFLGCNPELHLYCLQQ